MNRTSIHKLMESERVSLRGAFSRFLRRVRSPSILTAFAREKDVDAIVETVEEYLRGIFLNAMSRSFVRVGNAEVEQARKSLRLKHLANLTHKGLLHKAVVLEAALNFSFDPNDERAANLIESSQLTFLQDFNEGQKQAVRTALSQSLQSGDSYASAARAMRDSIGLTETQTKAVNNYRTLLTNSSSEALQRQLRDKRFDSTVTNAIERGDILSGDQVDRMVDSYTNRMLAFRADTIASTESHRVLSLARREAWNQIVDELGVDENEFTRTWNATEDKRTRDTHAAMDGQTVQGFDPFQSPSGAVLNYPGDPEAPPEETIRCRCVETYELS